MSVLVLFSLLSVAIAIICYWLHYAFNYWQRLNIPFVRPTPILGNLKSTLTFQRNFGMFISQDVYSNPKYANEPVVGVFTFAKPALVIRDPELLKTILIKDFNNFYDRFASCDPHGDALGSNNLFFVKNPQWHEMRTKLTPVFTSGKLKQMHPLMLEIGKELEKHLSTYVKDNDDSFVTEVKEISALFTTDMIATIGFGVRANSLQNPNAEFRRYGRVMLKFSLTRAFSFFCAFFMPSLVSILRIKLWYREFADFLRKSINHVMEERERTGNARNDLIDALVALKKEAAQDKNGSHFANNNDSLVAQAAIFLTAGFETSATTLSFALYELAKHPDIQKRLRQEIHAAFVNGNGDISFEEIQTMEYLNMIVDEILRLYPILPFLDRIYSRPKNAKSGFSLEPYSEHKLPDGMVVFVPIYGLQHDEKYWPNPEKFDPERFSMANRKSHQAMTYLPFGSGPRNCIGLRIGILQAKLGLVHFLKDHYVTTCDKTVKHIEFDPKSFLLQTKEGFYLRIVNDKMYEKTNS